MNIILQNYNDLLKKVIFDTFSQNLKENLNNIDASGNVMNYVNLLSSLDDSLCEIAKNTLVTTFEAINHSYSISHDRKKKYDIKSHHERSILTIFGEITFKRTFFKSKLNGKLYCHVDRLLGLHKYDYFDPYLKAIVTSYASNNSYHKVASYLNDLIGNRVSINDKFNYFSRQTVRNIIMSSIFSNQKPVIKDTPSSIYIIADEKWIHTQNNKGKDVMMKSIVVFEGIHNHKLINKHVFASLDYSFLSCSLDYIYNTYDTDKIKCVYLMGDGASWIKNLRNYFQFNKNIKVIYGLDKFHFKQALHHLCLDKVLEAIVESYVIHNNKFDFNKICDSLLLKHHHCSDTIVNKQNYILNNWKYIINLYKYGLSCPMESQISHNLADLFTSRPKAYSVKTIVKLTELRLLFKNKFNIKKLFLHNFNSKELLTINTKNLNFNIFDRQYNNSNIMNLIYEPFYSIPYDNSYHSA